MAGANIFIHGAVEITFLAFFRAFLAATVL
jgi:hypothetical protein